MSNLYEVLAEPELDRPVLVVMLQGWIDAGAAAATAVGILDQQLKATEVVRFDGDAFLDYRARRPIMELREGVNTGLVWPRIVLKAGKDRDGKDVLLLTGHEPDMAWRAFTEVTTSLAASYGVRLVLGMGAYPFASPHTRPSRVSITAGSAELAGSLPYLRNSVDVPEAEEAGYDGIWTAETSHDPFFPLLLGRRAHRAHRAGHGHRRRLRPQPDDCSPTWATTCRRSPRAASSSASAARSSRTSPSASPCRGPPGRPHARADPRHPGHLGLLERGHQARLPRRLLHAHPDDAVLQPGAEPVRRAQDLPGRRGRADDRGGRRGVRRLHLPRLHHRALPARGHRPGARARAGEGRQDAWRASRSSARASW
jgi:hypothetical protein